MSKLSWQDDDPAPSYEESILSASPPNFNSEKDSKPLHIRLTETRSRRVQSVISAHLEPYLASQQLDGSSKRFFILLPSDLLVQLTGLTTCNLVGVADLSNITVIRLFGDENRAAFWHQPVVVETLVASLKDSLIASGYKFEKPHLAPQGRQVGAPRDLQASARSFWSGKRFSLTGPDHDPTASTSHWKAGWRSEDENADSLAALDLDQARVNAKVKEFSFRTESEMGLLSTETVKAVWLEIEVGT